MEIIARRNHKLIYRDGDTLVKRFDESYARSEILNEAINQVRMAEAGLNVPRIHAVTVIDGGSAIVMDFVEGKTFWELFCAEPENQAELMRRFVGIQRDIHSRKHLLLTKYVDKLKRKILSSDLDASTRYDLSMRLDAMRPHTHVLHGDFIPSNVLITPSGVPCILDCSHASQGNATADAVKSYLLFRMEGLDDFAEAYIAEFCLQANVTRAYVNEWIPLIAAAQLVRTEDGKRREMLLAWTTEEY